MKFLIWIITCVLCFLSCIHSDQYVLSWTLWTIAIFLVILNLYLFFTEEEKPKKSTTDQVLARIQREAAAKSQVRDEEAAKKAREKYGRQMDIRNGVAVNYPNDIIPIEQLSNGKLVEYYGTTRFYTKEVMLAEMKNRGFNSLAELKNAIPSYYGKFKSLSAYEQYLKF